MRSTTAPNFQAKLIHSKRINFNRTLLLKHCFSGSQKRGPRFEPQFCAKKWWNQFGRRTGETQAFFFSKDALVYKLWFWSHKDHKGQVCFRKFHSPWRFWKKSHCHGELGDKGRLTWNSLHLILFYPTKRGEFGNPKLKEPNFPTDFFSVKLLLSNASRPKSSKMSPTAATRENDDSGSKVQPEEVVNMEHHAHVSFLIDKVDTMQKSRLQAVRGPALSIQF